MNLTNDLYTTNWWRNDNNYYLQKIKRIVITNPNQLALEADSMMEEYDEENNELEIKADDHELSKKIWIGESNSS